MTFCKSLNNAVSFRVPGNSNSITFNPCCLYDEYIPFHPTLFNKERKKYTEATTFLPSCSKCELKERTHGSSLRHVSNREFPDGIGNQIYKLEIVLDTTCNAACIQCGSDQSSLWRKEVDTVKKLYHIQPEGQIDAKIKSIQQSIDFNEVRFFHFWGGEPLLTDTHLKILNKIEDPSQITLSYTTNGSIFPNEEVLRIWEKFKEVKIGISIDGIEERFHYIRWPLKWDKVVRNLELFKTESPSNTWFHVNCCIIPLNVYYVDELGDWLASNFTHSNNGRPVNYNFIRGEGTMDIATTPMSLREEVWKRLPNDHAVANVLREVPVLDPSAMLNHINYWDPIRKIDWRKIFPDIVKHFK